LGDPNGYLFGPKTSETFLKFNSREIKHCENFWEKEFDFIIDIPNDSEPVVICNHQRAKWRQVLRHPENGARC
jgi:hypothetical protein